MASQTVMGELHDLSPLSKKLNVATDELNAALGLIEERLNALNLGVEGWLDDPPLDTESERDHDAPSRVLTEYQLGYGRTGDGWHLLVRKALYDQTIANGVWTYVDVETPQTLTAHPLLRQSRGLRVKAVELIPDLIDVLRARANEVIASVEAAKKIAEDLK